MRANRPEQQLSELSLQKTERWSHQDQLCRSLLDECVSARRTALCMRNTWMSRVINHLHKSVNFLRGGDVAVRLCVLTYDALLLMWSLPKQLHGRFEQLIVVRLS